MKILVTYDGSPDAKAALAYGIKKARATEGELIVLRLLRRNIFHDDEGEPCASEETLQSSLDRFEKKDTLTHRSGAKIPTTIVFTVINTLHDILQYAGNVGVDLIVAPPEFEPLMVKACCLVDIVTDRRGYYGMYKRAGVGQEAIL
jgi:universal stress protein family protein